MKRSIKKRYYYW